MFQIFFKDSNDGGFIFDQLYMLLLFTIKAFVDYIKIKFILNIHDVPNQILYYQLITILNFSYGFSCKILETIYNKNL